MGNVIARQRLFLNADKTKLVAEGDVEGAFLYVAPGDEIPEDAHDLFELEDGALPGFEPVDVGTIDDKVPSMAPPPGPKEKQAQRAAKAQAKADAQAKSDRGASTTKEAKPGQDKEAKPGDDKGAGEDGAGAGEGAGSEKGQ